jgi:hypothetical protein
MNKFFALSAAGLMPLTAITLPATLPAQAQVQVAQVSSEMAPLASYTAILGDTTLIRGGTASPNVVRRNGRSGNRTGGVPVYITLSGYSPKAELQAIAQAGQGNVVSVLNRYNHGKITIAGTTYPINAATSFRQGDTYRVNLVSAKPFSVAGSQTGIAQGTALSTITFIVPVNLAGTTTGTMMTVSGGRVSLNGTVQGVGGVSTMTPFTSVTRG